MRRLTLLIAAASSLATTSLVVACNLGDEFYPSGGGFGGSRGAVVDSGSRTPIDDPCATVEEGRSCTRSTGRCERKVHANVACNDVYSCDGYVWELETTAERSCEDGCPAAFVEDLPEACAAPNAGSHICEYPEGTCGCAPVEPTPDADAGDAGGDASDAGDGGEDPSDAGSFDAGDAASPKAYVWRCVRPEAGCPRTRPRIGAKCVRPMSCDYGSCLFEDGVTMRCNGDAWRLERTCQP